MTLYVVFTFDDFSRDTYAKVANILRSVGVKGVFFVNTGTIRGEDDQELIGELAKYHEVGSHSHSHLDLTQLPLEEALHDLLKSSEVLYELAGRYVSSFAYPYGRYNDKVIEAVRRAGFTIARTVEVNPPLTEIKDPLRLPTFFHDYPLTSKRLVYEVLKSLLMGRLYIAKLWQVMLTEKRRGLFETAKSLLNFTASTYRSKDVLLVFLFHPWMIEKMKAWKAFEEVALLAKSVGRVITLEEAYDRFHVGETFEK